MPQAISATPTMTLEQIACDLAQDEQDDFARANGQAVMALGQAPAAGAARARQGADCAGVRRGAAEPGSARGGRRGRGDARALAVYEAVNGKMNFALLQALGALLMLFRHKRRADRNDAADPRARAGGDGDRRGGHGARGRRNLSGGGSVRGGSRRSSSRTTRSSRLRHGGRGHAPIHLSAMMGDAQPRAAGSNAAQP